MKFGWCTPRGGAEGGAHLVSVLYESDVYVCNCGYGWLNSRCPSGSTGSYQSVSGSTTLLPELTLARQSVPHAGAAAATTPAAAAVHHHFTSFIICAFIKSLIQSWMKFQRQFSEPMRLQFFKKENHKKIDILFQNAVFRGYRIAEKRSISIYSGFELL